MNPPSNPSVNDMHLRLNAAPMARVEQTRTLDELYRAVRAAAAVSVGGGRHTMGEQQVRA